MNRKFLALAGLALVTAGCATVAAGTTQNIRVVSEPPGAQCQIQREGGTMSMVSTPGSATVPRSRHDLTLLCKLAGMDDATAIVPSQVHGGTIGNIIAGGIVGIAIDAASGANNNYLEVTIVVFAQNRFDSDAARDAYFADLRKRIESVAAAEMKRIMDSCPQSKKEFCAVEADRVKESRSRALEGVEARRSAARIGS